MAYTYISTTNKTYNLYYSDVVLKGGKQAKIYFLLPEDRKPNSDKSKLADNLPATHEIREIGTHKTPLVYKIESKMYVIESPLTGLWNVLVLYKEDVIEGWIANDVDGIMHHIVGVPNEVEYENTADIIILNEATEWTIEHDKEYAKNL